MARVTIGVPAYNNVSTIKRAIQSIAAQSFTEFRVILSDDQSKDGTYERCCELVKTDGRFQAIRQSERQGFMHFRRLVEAADTPYFVWLAGDDYWAPEFLEKTVAVLNQNQNAVSAIPKVAFVDAPAGTDAPDTSTLSGTWADRAGAFLSRPNGSRMYGLFRTKDLLAAFPKRTMNAYDWYLTLGFLRRGPQIEVPHVLLYRERTDWRDYSRIADAVYDEGIFRRYPLLDFSVAALRDGLIPPKPSLFRTLYQMNLEKHDERLMVVEPEVFFRGIAGQGTGDLRAKSATLAVSEVVNLIADPKTSDAVRDAAEAALFKLAEAGNVRALRYAGRHLIETGNLPAAENALTHAAQLGDPEARVRLAVLRFDTGNLEADALSRLLTQETRAGSDFAAAQLAAKFCEGRLAGISPGSLAELFSRCALDPGGTVVRAQAKLMSDGIAVPRDLKKAVRLLDGVAPTNPWARKDRGLLHLELGHVEDAIVDLTSAAESGADWALLNLLDIPEAYDRPRTGRIVTDLLRRSEDEELTQAVLDKWRNGLVPEAEPIKEHPKVSPASAKSETTMTAILVARNAEATLDRVLSHYAAERIPVILVDHGSTDGTSGIAMARRDAPVVGYFHEPYLGYFDLTRQLMLKRDLIFGIDSDWILHADADEFVETQDGTPLIDFVGRYSESKAVTFDCTEYTFVPRSEAEEHSPEDFPETMRHYVISSERDRKQRIFRKDCDLATWMQTGGHTVSLCPGSVAGENLRLRHYLGLSMDHIRSQYLPRVFSGEDRAKSWHGNRLAQSKDLVQAPDNSVLLSVDAVGFRHHPTVTSPPVFATVAPGIDSTRQGFSEDVELIVGTACRDTADWARQELCSEFPDLRVVIHLGPAQTVAEAGTRPTLHVLGFPANGATSPSDWLCGVAGLRQAAMIGQRRYREVRREDCEANAGWFREAVLDLLSSQSTKVTSFPRHSSLDVQVSHPEWQALGRDFLKDLGYNLIGPTAIE